LGLAELVELCEAAPNLRTLQLGGAFQLSTLSPVAGLARLERLSLDACTVTDEHLQAALPALPALRALSLRGCAFLRGEFLPACALLRRLDMADCGLALHLAPQVAAALAGLTALESLDLGGANGVTDATVGAIAALPRLRALGLRGANWLTEAGLEALADGPASSHLRVLDLEGCQGLSPGAWPALARLQALHSLSLARLPRLLGSTAMAENHAAALWRWPALRRLSLAGSDLHPSKLKLLAAACGRELQHLDISAPAAHGAHWGRRGGHARLPAPQLLDLRDAARQLRQLRTLSAAGACLPADTAVALMRCAPRLESLDLSGCAAAGRPPSACGRRWTSSGACLPGGGLGEPPCGGGARGGPAPGMQAPTAGEFAAALGALTALRTLRLEGCEGLTDRHLCHLSSLSALRDVALGRNRRVGDGALAALAAAAPALHALGLAGTAAGDAGLAALAAAGALREVRSLSVAGCGGVSGAGLAAAAAGGVGRCMRELDISDCLAVDDAVLAGVAREFPMLRVLRLAGCTAVRPAGLAALAALRRLTRLDAARCEAAVTDGALLELCGALGGLTAVNLGGAARLTPAGLDALRALRCLAEADLTCCTGLGADAELAAALRGSIAANVQLPQGSTSPTGSPFKRRPGSGAGGALLAEA
jgi:hypothetical protein